MKPSPGKPSTRPPRRLRRLAFRACAVMIGLTPFVVAEATFVALDWGRPSFGEDPFVGFVKVHPLFALNEAEDRYEIPPPRQAFFRPESFAAEKGAKEFRIFCLGGSTVQGRPWAIETSFTTWLEIGLNTADPTRQWEVVNCGGVSYASYRLVPILEEVLAYEPDLIILYTGHNEFLEDRTYGHIKRLPGALHQPGRLLAGTRTYTLLRRGYLRLGNKSAGASAGGRPVLGDETDAMLEYAGGLEKYQRDEKWRQDVIEHFCFNLHRMVQMTRDAGVPLLLVNPVCNLRDCAPFKAQHRDGLTPDQLKQWESLIAKSSELNRRNPRGSLELLERAMAIDDQHADLHFLTAKYYDALGDMEKAHEFYFQAKELDVCPLRILEAMNQGILDVARQTDTPLLDVRELFAGLTDEGIPSGYFLIDHVHPSIAGYQSIGKALTDELIRQGIVRPVDGWKPRQKEAFRKHFLSLDDLYFATGQQRLESLRLWTQGKAGAARPESREKQE